MKIAFFISSAINIENKDGNGFGFVPSRTAFTPEERFRQTQATIANVRLLFPDAHIFHYEIGKEADRYKQQLNYVDNLTFVSIEDLNHTTAEMCRTNNSKGLCEAVSTSLFLDHYIDQLKQYDYFIKLGGRYFYTNVDKTFLTQENTDKYLCKNIRNFEWLDWWGYPEEFKRNGCVKWTPSQSYIVGNGQLEDYKASMFSVKDYYLANPSLARILDFECLLYYFILENKPYIEIPWTNGGWGGQDGVYSEY